MDAYLSLARSYIWWPKLDAHIKEMACKCDECASVADIPAKAPGLYLSNLGKEYMLAETLLVAIDTFSK